MPQNSGSATIHAKMLLSRAELAHRYQQGLRKLRGPIFRRRVGPPGILEEYQIRSVRFKFLLGRRHRWGGDRLAPSPAARPSAVPAAVNRDTFRFGSLADTRNVWTMSALPPTADIAESFELHRPP
jgi:hypothetical protein